MKNIIIGIIIGGIVFTLGGVVATTAISSTNVTYQNKTVNTALDELYNEAVTGKELVAAAITNKGVSTTSTDTYETMATNINNIDTDNSELNQKINNLESKHNSDVASLTGSISNLSQSLTELKNLTWKLVGSVKGRNSISLTDVIANAKELKFVVKNTSYGYVLSKQYDVNMLENERDLIITDGYFFSSNDYSCIKIIFNNLKAILNRYSVNGSDYSSSSTLYVYYR